MRFMLAGAACGADATSKTLTNEATAAPTARRRRGSRRLTAVTR
jgi:hypothetical protein